MLTLIYSTYFWGNWIKSHKTCFNCPPQLREIKGLPVCLTMSVSEQNKSPANFAIRRRSDLRLLYIDECYFLDTGVILWDFYYELGQKQGQIQQFVLVPQTDRLNFRSGYNWHLWQYIGTCESGLLRSDLEQLLAAFLPTNVTGWNPPEISFSLFIMTMESFCDFDFKYAMRIKTMNKRNKQKQKRLAEELLQKDPKSPHTMASRTHVGPSNGNTRGCNGQFNSEMEWTSRDMLTEHIPPNYHHHHHQLKGAIDIKPLERGFTRRTNKSSRFPLQEQNGHTKGGLQVHRQNNGKRY